tara:strand:+ start:17770 stop:18759 length:990 start_codon:yes stop_codon:yes gene_type:complete
VNILIKGGGSIGLRHLSNCHLLWPSSSITLVSKYSNIPPSILTNPAIQVVNHLNDVIDKNFSLSIIASPASHHISDLNHVFDISESVLVEKPLFSAWDSDGIDFSHVTSKNVIVGYVLRFDPIILNAKAIIDSGKFGSVLSARVWAGQDLRQWRPNVDYNKTVSASRNLGGGVLHELSHEIDYITYLLGQPTSLYSSLGNYSALDLDVEDSAMLHLIYPDKCVTINTDFIASPPSLGFELLFEKATLNADFVNRQLILSAPSQEPQYYDVNVQSFNDLYIDQLRYLDSIRNSAPSNSKYTPCTLQESINVMKIIQAAIQFSNSIPSISI